MDIQNLKQKIKDGQIGDEELLQLLGGNSSNGHTRRKSGFMQNILKGFIDGYSTPNLWRAIMESTLIFVVIVGVVILTYADKMDTMITAVMLSSILGFLFGKRK